MSTEVPMTPKHDTKPINAQEARARATATTESEFQQLKEKRSINPRKAALALALATGAVIGSGIYIMETATKRQQATNETDGQPRDDLSAQPTDGAHFNESLTPVEPSSPSPNSISTLEAQPIMPSGTLSTLELEAGQNDELLAQDFARSLTTWANEGSSTAYEYQAQNGKGKSVDEVADEIAQNNRQKFIDTYIGDSTPNERVSHFIESGTRINSETVMYAILTDPESNFQNLDYYKRTYELDSPVSKVGGSEGQRILQFTVKGSSNYEDTIYFNKQTEAEDVTHTAYSVTFIEVDGKETITDIIATRVEQ